MTPDHSALIERLENECCNCGYAGLMHEAYEALRDLTEWRDITTAPKDGTVIDLFYPERGRWTDARWTAMGWGRDEWRGRHTVLVRPSEKPTHWLPLPSAPNQARGADKL